MELIEIKNLFEMDTGAPAPFVVSNDTELSLLFYSTGKGSNFAPEERNTVYDVGINVLKFDGYLKYSFGIPGNETLHGHPYYKLGMRSYSFYELKNSDWIKKLEDIGRVHPYYEPDKWKYYKHYILTFHDNMFECIAKSFEVKEEELSMYQRSIIILNELSVRQF